jgi:hypothetical protein
MSIASKLIKFGLSFFVILLGLSLVVTGILGSVILVGIPIAIAGLGVTLVGLKWLLFQ